MKKIILPLLIITITGCSDNQVYKENLRLKEENKALNAKLNSLKGKYIFDNVFVRHIPQEGNSLKPGSKYKGEFVFVAYNDEDYVLFTEKEGSKEYDTLTIKRKVLGAYDFETTLTEGKNTFYFKPRIMNKVAQKHQNLGYHDITIVDVAETK